MEQQQIRVIIVDDHHLIREAIRSMLNEAEHIEIVGEGWVGEHLFSLMETQQPDVVLLDLMMPHHENGDPSKKFAPIQALQKLHERHPETALFSYPAIHRTRLFKALLKMAYAAIC